MTDYNLALHAGEYQRSWVTLDMPTCAITEQKPTWWMTRAQGCDNRQFFWGIVLKMSKAIGQKLEEDMRTFIFLSSSHAINFFPRNLSFTMLSTCGSREVQSLLQRQSMWPQLDQLQHHIPWPWWLVKKWAHDLRWYNLQLLWKLQRTHLPYSPEFDLEDVCLDLQTAATGILRTQWNILSWEIESFDWIHLPLESVNFLFFFTFQFEFSISWKGKCPDQ